MNQIPAAEGGLPLPINGDTRVYAIIGDPIGQVGSPRVFNTLFRERGVPAVLVPLHVSPDALEDAVRGFRAFANFDGIIVTVPHKVAVAGLVDRVGDAGKRIGAVNAIRREPDGTLLGDNFDGKGCVIGLQREGHSVSGKRTLIGRAPAVRARPWRMRSRTRGHRPSRSSMSTPPAPRHWPQACAPHVHASRYRPGQRTRRDATWS